jgi:hypothetical protein
MTTWQIIGLYLMLAGAAIYFADPVVRMMMRRFG